HISSCCLIPLRHPSSPLFPYTTLFRSIGARQDCVPVPQPRPPYGLGPGEERDARSLQAEAEWRCPRLRSWIRFRRRWHGRDSARSEEHTSELQSLRHLVCRLLLEKKKK